MKIGIVSDNHRDDATLMKILERENNVDIWIHCGDSQMDIENTLMKKFIGVRGNTDHAPFLKEQLIEVGENKILVSHGHLYGIDFTTREIVESAKLQGAQLILHGHTHIPRDILVDDIRIINPGSTSWPRGGFDFGSYVVIESTEHNAKFWDATFISTKTWSKVII
ncbi:MAG: YfcE family phosphodiesterase [Culicoidibacterales bacterium]